MTKKFLALAAGALFALSMAACGGGDNTNTTTNTTNTANRAATPVPTATPLSKNPTRPEYESNKPGYAEEAKKSGSKIGSGTEDVWLWIKTRAALAAADDLRDSTINVDVDNSVITLTGNVTSQEQVKKADTVAKGIEGQKGVKNMLKVAPAGGNTNANANKNANAANTKKG